MPIFEYLCKSCGSSFEKLVSRASNDLYSCPKCNSEDTEKKLSAFGGIINGSSTSECSSASACQSMGVPGCGGGNCPMH